MDRAQQGVFIEHFDSIVDGGNVLSYYATYASTGSFAFAPRHFTFYDRPYHNFDQFRKFRASFDELQSDVSIDVVAKDRAERGRLRAYDANDNLLEEKFSNYLWEETHETVTISRPQNDIAYVEAWGTHFLDNLVFGSREIDQDLYTIDVNSPTRLDFSTILPGAGPLGFHNGLDLPAGSDLRMELLDPDGNVVATSTSDLIHDAIEIGTYQLRIYAETTYGEYILQSNPSPIIPRFFDVTPEFGSIAEGFLGVATQPYLPERQFGWTDSTGLGIFELTRGNALTRDVAVMRSGTFVVDVPNGNYDVTVYFGNVRRRSPVSVTIEGNEEIHTPLLGANIKKIYQASVDDGQLSLEFSGHASLGRRIRVVGFSIEEAPSKFDYRWVKQKTAQTDQRIVNFDPFAHTSDANDFPEKGHATLSGQQNNQTPQGSSLQGSSLQGSSLQGSSLQGFFSSWFFSSWFFRRKSRLILPLEQKQKRNIDFVDDAFRQFDPLVTL